MNINKLIKNYKSGGNALSTSVNFSKKYIKNIYFYLEDKKCCAKQITKSCIFLVKMKSHS